MGGISEIKVELNDAGIKDLLNGEGVQAFLLDKARQVEAIAESGGGEFEATVQPGKSRARASVITSDYEARVAESENQTLSRAGYMTGGTPGGGR